MRTIFIIVVCIISLIIELTAARMQIILPVTACSCFFFILTTSNKYEHWLFVVAFILRDYYHSYMIPSGIIMFFCIMFISLYWRKNGDFSFNSLIVPGILTGLLSSLIKIASVGIIYYKLQPNLIFHHFLYLIQGCIITAFVFPFTLKLLNLLSSNLKQRTFRNIMEEKSFNA